MEALQRLIRTVPDFPKKGINFIDITPILADPAGLVLAVNALVEPFRDAGVEIIAGAESRGFTFGTAAAVELGAGFVPVRKPGKLPCETVSATYELEYGTDTLEVHKDAVKPGQKVLMIDDLLATGGTMAACCDMIGQLGGEIVGASFVFELTFLRGRDKLGDVPVHSLIKIDGD